MQRIGDRIDRQRTVGCFRVLRVSRLPGFSANACISVASHIQFERLGMSYRWIRENSDPGRFRTAREITVSIYTPHPALSPSEGRGECGQLFLERSLPPKFSRIRLHQNTAISPALAGIGSGHISTSSIFGDSEWRPNLIHRSWNPLNFAPRSCRP